MSSGIKTRRVKDVFSVDKYLTKHLWDIWGIPKPDWTTSKSYWWVTWDKDNWIAYSGLRIHDEESVYLGPTYVRYEYRGQGIQTKLIKKRIAFTKKLGFSKVLTSTNLDAYASSNNLIKCNFRLIEPWPGIDPNSLAWQLIV